MFDDKFNHEILKADKKYEGMDENMEIKKVKIFEKSASPPPLYSVKDSKNRTPNSRDRASDNLDLDFLRSDKLS